MTQDIRNLDGVVNLHPRVDAHTLVRVEVAPGFLACGEKDSCVVCVEEGVLALDWTVVVWG